MASCVPLGTQEVGGVIVPPADEGDQIRERSVVTWLEAQVAVTGPALGPQAMLVTTSHFTLGESSQRWLLLHTLRAPSYRDVSAELVPCPCTMVRSQHLILSAEHLHHGSLPLMADRQQPGLEGWLSVLHRREDPSSDP